MFIKNVSIFVVLLLLTVSALYSQLEQNACFYDENDSATILDHYDHEIMELPEFLKKPKIKYPRKMLKEKICGSVLLLVKVNSNGEVSSVDVLQMEHDMMDQLCQTAVKAIYKTKFKAATRKGIKCPSIIQIIVTYNLDNQDIQKISFNIHNVNERILLPGKVIPSKNEVYYIPPQVIELIKPQYPSYAIRSNMQGIVILEICLDEKGKVLILEVKKSVLPGPGGLDDLAIQAVRKSTFSPAFQDNKPVSSWITIPFEFKLDCLDEKNKL